MIDEVQQPDIEAAPVRVTRRQRICGVGGSVVAFIVVYVGLAGPVAFLHRSIEFQPFRNVIETIYAPVVFVVENDVPPFSGLIKAWIELFA